MMHEWTLYTRTGCHLCEDAEEWLRELAAVHQATLRLVNILADPVSYEQYKWRIPVLIIGAQRWEAPLDEANVQAYLAHARSTPPTG